MVKLLLLMLLAHIADDFYLQSILANMKQKRWWEHSEWYKPLYRDKELLLEDIKKGVD